MEKYLIKGVEINRVPIRELLLNRTMFVAYFFLALGFIGVYEVIDERYFKLVVDAHDAGLNIGSTEVAQAMKEAIFGAGGEVRREQPWTLYRQLYVHDL